MEGTHVVTVDASGSEIGGGHVVVTGNRVTAVGRAPHPPLSPGPAEAVLAGEVSRASRTLLARAGAH